MTPPQSGLNRAMRGSAQKAELVDWVFDRVARRYDLGNDIMSLGWHTRWKRRLVDLATIESHHRVLDLAAGTGGQAAAEGLGEVVVRATPQHRCSGATKS